MADSISGDHVESQTLINAIFDRLNIHVYGACIPYRDKPLDVYSPVHLPYPERAGPHYIDAGIRARAPGAQPRQFENEDGEKSWIYDRDVVTTWRLPDPQTAYEMFF
jgi:hypothetical protein